MSSAGWRRGMAELVTIRDVEVDDIPIFFHFQLDPVASQMADFPIRSWDAHASHWRRVVDNDTIVVQTVLVDGQVAGNVVSFDDNGQREVGYWLGRDYWGRGIATRALAAFLLREVRRPLRGYVAKHNHASRRVLEKCGFTLTTDDASGYHLELRA